MHTTTITNWAQRTLSATSLSTPMLFSHSVRSGLLSGSLSETHTDTPRYILTTHRQVSLSLQSRASCTVSFHLIGSCCWNFSSGSGYYFKYVRTGAWQYQTFHIWMIWSWWLDSLRWFSQCRSPMAHFWEVRTRGLWPPKSNSAQICV